MAGTVTPTLPNVGDARSVADPNTRASLVTLRDALNAVLTSSNTLDGAQLGAGTIAAAGLASNSVTTAKITDANVTDAKLASPNNSAYKTLLTATNYTATNGTGTYYFTVGTLGGLRGTGGPTTTADNLPVIFDYTSGDYTVGSLTTKFRVKLEVIVGATSPSTVTFTAGLYPLTISGGNYTLGTVVTGSTALSSSLATNTISRFNSGDFSASALLTDPGPYVLGVVIGSITVPAGINVAGQLQTRNV